MPFPHPILGHSNAIHILTLSAYDAHKKYDPPIYIPTAARRGTGTWQTVTGIFDQRAPAHTHTHTHTHHTHTHTHMRAHAHAHTHTHTH
jgi:hypothetical protein